MSNSLRITYMLKALRDLDRFVTQCAECEAELNREFRVTTAKARNALDRACSRIEDQCAADIATAEQERQDCERALHARLTAVTERVEKAFKADKKRVFDAARRTEDIAKSKIQETLWITRNAFQAKATKAKADAEHIKANFTELRERFDGVSAHAERLLGRYRRFIPPRGDPPRQVIGEELDPHSDERLLRDLEARIEEISHNLFEFEKLRLQPLLGGFRAAVVLLLLMAVHAGLLALLLESDKPVLAQFLHVLPIQAVTISALLLLVLICALRILLTRQAKPLALAVLTNLPGARQTHDLCLEIIEQKRDHDLDRFAREREEKAATIQARWGTAADAAAEHRSRHMQEIEAKRTRLLGKATDRHKRELAAAHDARDQHCQQTESAAKKALAELHAAHEQDMSERRREYESRWREIERTWNNEVLARYRVLRSAADGAMRRFPEWDAPVWKRWEPPADFDSAVAFGRLHVNLAELVEKVPEEDRLRLPQPTEFDVPIALTFPEEGALVIETATKGREQAIGVLRNVMLRLLTASPPGKVRFTLIDPVGLGQSFAAFMHLADYEEALVAGRIWTEPRQIEQQLADLNEHMEKVIQMYLRNEYANITEYNRTAGEVAEKVHFVVIADFPANFSETAARRLLSIATSGARCGVYVLMNWDRRHTLPENFAPDQLYRNCIHIGCADDQFMFVGVDAKGVSLNLQMPPSDELTTQLLRKIGLQSVDAARVEVPFSTIVPGEGQHWTGDTSAELRVAVGRTGATKLQPFALGKGTLQHALIAGKTGSGKSTFLHVLITNLALWFSPREVEFYLIDFKKGVEFKTYATHALPHARAVAVESDREFGLSVLMRVDQELKRRGDLFREAGVQDVSAYRRIPGNSAMPRTLLIIDEFQEFFVEDDRIAQSASLLLDRIVRQGRAFGLHVLLGTQTLGGAYTLARATLGQMAVRIALQCNEADSYLILSEDNAAARLLSRPGEAIYNDASGLEQGNNPFQVVWLSDAERDRHLAKVAQIAKERGYEPQEPQIVFEGNAPADITQNRFLHNWLMEPRPQEPPSVCRAWLGQPNTIKGPTEAVFERRSGSNLLLIGQRDEAALAILTVAAVSLAAQHPPGQVRFFLLDGATSESAHRGHLARLADVLPSPSRLVAYRDVPEIIDELAREATTRQEDLDTACPPIFLVIFGLQRFAKLRYEEDFSFSMDDSPKAPDPGRQFDQLLREGPVAGLHVLAWCDTLNNVNRTISRRALGEFEMRVLFQMSAADSANLIDSPLAGELGLYRALFHNEQEGTSEKFRPYSLPGPEWLEVVRERLAEH